MTLAQHLELSNGDLPHAFEATGNADWIERRPLARLAVVFQLGDRAIAAYWALDGIWRSRSPGIFPRAKRFGTLERAAEFARQIQMT